LDSIVADRFSAIHDLITEWEKRDPGLRDKEGFLEFIKTQDIGQFNVGNTEIWMRYYKMAKKEGVTVAEYLFDMRRELQSKKLSKERDPDQEKPEKISVIDPEKRKELEEMDERLKTHDPARIKRLNE